MAAELIPRTRADLEIAVDNLGDSDLKHSDSISRSMSSSIQTPTPSTPYTPDPSGLLTQLNTNELSLMVKHIIENSATFADLKHQSKKFQSIFINKKVSGDWFIKYKRHRFVKLLKDPETMKAGIANKIHRELRALSESDIQDILDKESVYAMAADSKSNVDATDEIKTKETNSSSEQETSKQDENKSKYMSYTEIGNLAISDFQTSARKMLIAIQDAMKSNNVCGKEMVAYYSKKKDLEQYLERNVRRKNVNVLMNMLWNDYLSDKENKLFIINEYDDKKLLKYFISLYMKYIRNVIIQQKLDSNKCLQLKRKGIANLLRTQCGLSIGTATNIADVIYCKIE